MKRPPYIRATPYVLGPPLIAKNNMNNSTQVRQHPNSTRYPNISNVRRS